MKSKLVRDNIPNLIELSGKVQVYHQATEDEFIESLDEKLQEEVAEYLQSHDEKELADILEVVITIASTKNISESTLTQLKEEKNKRNGKFTKKYILELQEV